MWEQGIGLGPHKEVDNMRDTELGCCRRAVQHRVSAAAAVQSSGGTLLHEYPDFILPFIIQSLAHHPDFPTQEVQRPPSVPATHSFALPPHHVNRQMKLCGGHCRLVTRSACSACLSFWRALYIKSTVQHSQHCTASQAESHG